MYSNYISNDSNLRKRANKNRNINLSQYLYEAATSFPRLFSNETGWAPILSSVEKSPGNEVDEAGLGSQLNPSFVVMLTQNFFSLATSFPGALLFPPPGNKVVSLVV